MQEFERGEQAYRKRNIDESVEHLRKAVAADEGFVEALNNLGSRLMEKENPREAAVYFRKAVELDGNNVTPLLNLGLALILLGDAPEAERLARRAAALDYASDRASKVLNLSLRAQGKVSSFR